MVWLSSLCCEQETVRQAVRFAERAVRAPEMREEGGSGWQNFSLRRAEHGGLSKGRRGFEWALLKYALDADLGCQGSDEAADCAIESPVKRLRGQALRKCAPGDGFLRTKRRMAGHRARSRRIF